MIQAMILPRRHGGTERASFASNLSLWNGHSCLPSLMPSEFPLDQLDHHQIQRLDEAGRNVCSTPSPCLRVSVVNPLLSSNKRAAR